MALFVYASMNNVKPVNLIFDKIRGLATTLVPGDPEWIPFVCEAITFSRRHIQQSVRLPTYKGIKKQEMSLKKTNGVGLKRGKILHKAKYLYINLTQMTENLE